MKKNEIVVDFIEIDLTKLLSFGEDLIPELIDSSISLAKHAATRKYTKYIYSSKKDINLTFKTIYYGVAYRTKVALREYTDKELEAIKKYNLPLGIRVIMYEL